MLACEAVQDMIQAIDARKPGQYLMTSLHTIEQHQILSNHMSYLDGGECSCVSLKSLATLLLHRVELHETLDQGRSAMQPCQHVLG